MRTTKLLLKSVKLVIAALCLGASVATVSAQDLPTQPNLLGTNILGSLAQPVTTTFNYLAANTNAPAATNWTIATMYSRGGGHSGASMAFVYYLNPYIGTQIRVQYLKMGGSTVWLPNGTITAQSAYKPFGNLPVTLRPLIEAGVACDLHGNLKAVVGAGTELDLYRSKGNGTLQRISAFYGVEKYDGQGGGIRVQQYGLAVNLNLKPVATWLSGL